MGATHTALFLSPLKFTWQSGGKVAVVCRDRLKCHRKYYSNLKSFSAPWWKWINWLYKCQQTHHNKKIGGNKYDACWFCCFAFLKFHKTDDKTGNAHSAVFPQNTTTNERSDAMVRKRYYYFRLSTLKYVYIYIFTNGLLNFFSQKWCYPGNN